MDWQLPLYHGTSCTKAKLIRKSGLRCGETPVHVESQEDCPSRSFETGVYVADDLETAVLYAYDASKECRPEHLSHCDADEENMCVVKINKIPVNAQVGSDGHGSLMVDSDIPPRDIEVLYPADLKRVLGVTSLLEAI